jgi:hypothetical protein
MSRSRGEWMIGLRRMGGRGLREIAATLSLAWRCTGGRPSDRRTPGFLARMRSRLLLFVVLASTFILT